MKNTTIEERKKEVFELLDKAFIERGLGADSPRLAKLKEDLDTRGFFTSPASTKYHSCYEGGLCDHSLLVYHNLVELVKLKGLESKYPEHSLILVSLLHDISKMGFYELSIKNEKVYSDFGGKSDSLGKFDWVSSYVYKTKPAEKRFVFGSHEETSEYLIRHYVVLTTEESAAILTHHGGMSWDSTKGDVSPIFNRYPLAILLHMADMLSCYIDESISE